MKCGECLMEHTDIIELNDDGSCSCCKMNHGSPGKIMDRVSGNGTWYHVCMRRSELRRVIAQSKRRKAKRALEAIDRLPESWVWVPMGEPECNHYDRQTGACLGHAN